MSQPLAPSDWKWSILFYLPFFPVAILLRKVGDAIVDALYKAPSYQILGASEGMRASFFEVSFLILLFAVIGVVVTPIIEELWFRGIGLAGFMRFGSPVAAVVWTSLVFGVLHGPRGFLYATVLGMVLAVIRLRTGSLYCSMLVHGLHNVLAVAWAILAPWGWA